jgi:hypothetical protein
MLAGLMTHESAETLHKRMLRLRGVPHHPSHVLIAGLDQGKPSCISLPSSDGQPSKSLQNSFAFMGVKDNF